MWSGCPSKLMSRAASSSESGSKRRGNTSSLQLSRGAVNIARRTTSPALRRATVSQGMSPAKVLGPSAMLAAVAEAVSGVLTVSQPGAGRKPGKSATLVDGVVVLREIVGRDDEPEDEPHAVTRTTSATAAVMRFI